MENWATACFVDQSSRCGLLRSLGLLLGLGIVVILTTSCSASKSIVGTIGNPSSSNPLFGFSVNEGAQLVSASVPNFKTAQGTTVQVNLGNSTQGVHATTAGGYQVTFSLQEVVK